MPSPIKLPAEQFLLPVMRFNDVVGPLFNELRPRFPLSDEHTDAGLARSLGVFLEQCFVHAVQRMEEIRPASLTNEEWQVASEEVKRPHLHWQANLKYLKHRRHHYADMMGYRANGKIRSETYEFTDQELKEGWLEA
jgi:hypothetical protein